MNPRGSRMRRIAQHAVVDRDRRAAPRPPPPRPPPPCVRQPRRSMAARAACDSLRMNRPRVAVALVDGVLPHLVHVEEEVFLALRRDVENRPVVRHRVLDRLAEMPRLRRDRVRHVGARQLHVEHEGDLDRRRVADRLRQDADLIVEVGRRPDAAVEPRRVVRRPTASRRPACLRPPAACGSPTPTMSMPRTTSGS